MSKQGHNKWAMYCRGVGKELHVAMELCSLALLVLLLPWPLAFRGLRWLTRFSFFQGPGLHQALAAMTHWHGPRGPFALRLLALHRLVDMADYFLTLKYGNGWLRRYLHVSGDTLPAAVAGAAPLLVTFHFGQGFWALRLLREQGFAVAWLHAPPPLSAPLGEKLNAWMGRRRIAQVARLCGAPAIAVGGSIERMRKRLLEDGQPVMVMPDAPLQPGQSSIPVRLLGRAARLPAGAIRMAAESAVPVLLYSIYVDPQTGHRYMRVQGPLNGLAAPALAQCLADHLQQALEQQPEAWHVWPWAASFLQEDGR